MTTRAKGLAIGKDGFKLEPSIAEDVIAIIGRRGRGKSTTARVFVEELHDVGARFCVADPTGAWWGLKSSRDGKAAGIPVVVMGGEHQDVPLEETAGRVIADFVADPSSPSVVLDLRPFRKAQSARFMTDFLEQLYHKNRDPLHLVLDEADQFAPQRVMGEVARLVGAAEDVCKMGRIRGLHPIVITQRPAALNKNVLSQAGLLIAHELTGPQDRKAVDEWIRANADETQRDKFMETIAGLGRGVAWFWQPEAEIFQRVHVRAPRTFDSSATPKRGEKRVAPRVLAEVDLDELTKRIAATIEKARADDPKELRRRIAELERELKAAKVPVIEAPVVELVPALSPAELGELNDRVEAARETARALTLCADRIVDALRAVTQIPKRAPAGTAGRATTTTGRGGIAAGNPAPRVHARPASAGRPSSNGDQKLANGERKILAALAQYPDGRTKRQVALLTAYAVNGGGFNNYLSALRSRGLLEGAGDGLLITDSGLAALGTYEPLPQGAELLEHWMRQLGKAEREILAALVDAYPGALSKERLAESTASGYVPTGGGFNNALSRLRTLELIQGRGEIVAAEELFT